MTYIDKASALRGSVRRLITTRDASGNVIDESYQEIVGEHWLDLQPLSHDERITSEQLKIKATHKVYPEFNIVADVALHDFYRIDGRDYRIVEPWNYRTVGYFRVFDGSFGAPSVELTTKLFFSFDNVGPGTYTFGAGIFATVPTFGQAPDIIGLLTNDGSFYIDNVTATGFRLVDRGIGLSPLASIYIWEKPIGVTDVNRWSFSGIGPGVYTFGTSPLIGMPSSFITVPTLYTQDNNAGQHYVTNKTTTGFTIVDKLTGPTPSVTVVIVRN